MGHIPLPPRPQFEGESDEAYDNYIHDEYRAYLVDGAERARMSAKEALIIMVGIALFALAMLVIAR